MGRYKPHHHINDPGDAPSSYPLYPPDKERKEGAPDIDASTEIAGLVSKIGEWYEKEYDPSSGGRLSK